jgi:hypothetical protein
MRHEPRDPRSAAVLERDDIPGLDAARKQLERVLASETLRAAEGLRRLFRFLAEKTFSGEGDNLKEYSVGLDGVGKPSTYDPRQDAGVRLQASRLRQKLDEYYRTEGAQDSLIIELPKGGFKIVWKRRAIEAVAAPVQAATVESPAQGPTPRADVSQIRKWRNLAFCLAATALVLAGITAWVTFGAPGTRASSRIAVATSPELELLWKPFVTSQRHLIMAFADPLFVRFQSAGRGDVLVHKGSILTWDDYLKSPELGLIARSMGNPPARPSFEYAMRSDLYSIFVLGQFFATRRADVSVMRMGEFSWQQFAHDDVILLGSRSRNNEKQSAMPAQSVFVVEADGVRNLKPLPGEPALFPSPQTSMDGDGDTLELVSIMPGPLGRTRTFSVTSNRAWSCFGAVQSMTDPAFARVIAAKIRQSNGELPPNYQLVLRISYRSGTPINSAYVTHRAIPVERGDRVDKAAP